MGKFFWRYVERTSCGGSSPRMKTASAETQEVHQYWICRRELRELETWRLGGSGSFLGEEWGSFFEVCLRFTTALPVR